MKVFSEHFKYEQFKNTVFPPNMARPLLLEPRSHVLAVVILFIYNTLF